MKSQINDAMMRFDPFFPSFCDHEIFIKPDLPVLLVLVGQRKKSQKYFDPSAFTYNLNESNLRLGVMNFQKWNLFSGSPGIFSQQSKIESVH